MVLKVNEQLTHGSKLEIWFLYAWEKASHYIWPHNGGGLTKNTSCHLWTVWWAEKGLEETERESMQQRGERKIRSRPNVFSLNVNIYLYVNKCIRMYPVFSFLSPFYSMLKLYSVYIGLLYLYSMRGLQTTKENYWERIHFLDSWINVGSEKAHLLWNVIKYEMLMWSRAK